MRTHDSAGEGSAFEVDAGALEESKSLPLMAPALKSHNIAHSDNINALSCPRTKALQT